MTGIESCRKASRDSLESIHTPEDVIDVTLPEGRLEGLTLKETGVQGIHKEVCIGGGHLGAHGSTCWCMEGKDVAFKYCQSVFACLWQWEILVLTSVLPFIHSPLSFTTTPHHSLLPFIHYYPSCIIHYHAPFIIHHSLQLVMHHSLPCTLHRSPFITTSHASFTTMYPFIVHYYSCIIHY